MFGVHGKRTDIARRMYRRPRVSPFVVVEISFLKLHNGEVGRAVQNHGG
jgi:hypothetical protein